MVKAECHQCRSQIVILRHQVKYWPDHLWPGKVQAHYQCSECQHKSIMWAHELPVEWRQDWPCPNWEGYCLPRLIDSCYLHNIKPAIFTDVLKPFALLGARLGIMETWRVRLARWIAPLVIREL